MESQPTIRKKIRSDLQNRLALIAYIPILCLGVLAAGGLIFLSGSSGVRIFGIFALIGVAVSVFVAFRTIRSVLQSIDEVAHSANELVVAQQALLDSDRQPIDSWEKIETESDDELGRVAASLNAFHQNVLEVDASRNETIKKGISNIVVNLARRSQTLLDRQVEYIDTLESSEEDPDRLEQLFKVDHLATRMRRNAESLLVMADADPGRRRGGPVDVADVLRVAMGEIENYQHIELTSVEPGQVTSAAAVDLAHMAAELMENATQFSPPSTPVEVAGDLEGDEYVITVVDHGMGMPADQLALANTVLADPPELGLEMGRSLGFIVIGRLAQRVGAEVSLSKTADSGVTATIAVPTSVFSKVGDNSGTRRSIVAPDHRDEPEEAQEETGSKSPALSRLLGLNAKALGAPAEEQTVEDSSDAEQEDESSGWTPPAVTPDAPVPPSSFTDDDDDDAAETSVAEESDLADNLDSSLLDSGLPASIPDGLEESGWTPPSVTHDATTIPLPGAKSSVEDADDDELDSEVDIDDGVSIIDAVDADEMIADEVDTDDEVVGETDDSEDGDSEDESDESEVEASHSDDDVSQDAESHDVEAEDDSDEPSEVPDLLAQANESLTDADAPSKLEEAIPTGDAFESGMASLLDVTSESKEAVADSDIDAPAEETGTGLTRRKRGQSKVPTGEGRPVAASSRDPEEIRSMLSRYRDGIKGNSSPATTDTVEES